MKFKNILLEDNNDIEKKLKKTDLKLVPGKIKELGILKDGWFIKNAEYYGSDKAIKNELMKVGLDYLDFYHNKDGWFIFSPEVVDTSKYKEILKDGEKYLKALNKNIDGTIDDVLDKSYTVAFTYLELFNVILSDAPHLRKDYQTEIDSLYDMLYKIKQI